MQSVSLLTDTVRGNRRFFWDVVTAERKLQRCISAGCMLCECQQEGTCVIVACAFTPTRVEWGWSVKHELLPCSTHHTLPIPLNTPPTTTRQAKQRSLVALRNINVSTSNSEVTSKSKHISTALSITPVNATLLCVVKTKGLTLCRTGKGAVVQFTRELRIINLIFYNWRAL